MEDKQIVEYSSKAPLPAVAVTYLASFYSKRRHAGPGVGRGDSGRWRIVRLYQSLVYEQQIAQQASFECGPERRSRPAHRANDSRQRQITGRGGEGAQRATQRDFERRGDAGRIGEGEEPVSDREAD